MKELNRFFGTPKRAAVSIGCIAAVAFLGAGTVFAAGILAKQNSVGKEEQAAANGADPVTLDGAIAAALYDAGLSSEEVTVTKAKRDTDDGIVVYDIEFLTGNTEYEYEIYEDTGAVYSKSKETIAAQTGSGVQNTGAQQSGGQPEADTSSGADSRISLDEAKNIAVSDAGLTLSDVTCTKAEPEEEDGIAVYEIKFNTPAHEYKYEIDASDGAIRSKDKESRESGSGSSAGSAGTDIGLEQAKVIALNHAGCQASEVHFSKAKFEKEHGSVIYEVEFYKDGIEYEYTIDAETGEILEFDSEEDD